MESFNELTSEIDVLSSFAEAAISARIPYVRPQMIAMHGKELSKLHLVKARHPCLEMMDDTEFIGNDVEFSKGKLILCRFLHN